MPVTRLLLLGRRADVLARLTDELRGPDLHIEGSTAPETAATDFDARAFDLIGFGGGLTDDERTRLTSAFRAQNPAVRVVDLIAPLAVKQLRYLAAQPADSRPTLTDVVAAPLADGSWALSFTAAEATTVTLTVYWYAPAPGEEVVMTGAVPAGPVTTSVEADRLGRGPHFIGVEAASGEIATGRFDVE